MDELIVVSVDSHATMPASAWGRYLEPEYHGYLPELHEDDDRWHAISARLSQMLWSIPEVLEVVDAQGVHAPGVEGLWDARTRLGEMDREGIAAEFVYFGDHRAAIPFVDVGIREYGTELHLAGLRAYHRWAADEFGGHTDRLRLVGGAGYGADLDAMLTELDWLADHGFAGTYAPKFIPDDSLPPLSDEFWEPFWARCEQHGLPLFVHAGHGVESGAFYRAAMVVEQEMQQVDDPDAVDWGARYIALLTEGAGDVFADPRPRRAMWQLMFGGVFDRHPELKLVMTEVRADWLPATLRYLDETFAGVRGEFPAERLPSEYWRSNCLTSLSFVHRSEVEMRDEIGIETISFGRDYPHEEATWPNTPEWLHAAFEGVPADELRLMLGENAVRFFGLDRDHLVDIARRIGPTVEEFATPAELHPIMLAHFDGRGGYSRPAEGADRLGEIEQMVHEDLAAAGVHV